MRILLTFISLLLTYLSNPLYASEFLSAQIDTLIQKTLPHATVGILVKDLQTGQTIYSKNADKLFAPASTIKLFTAAAALMQLPFNQQFTTTLAQKNTNYYLKFDGSPSFTKGNLVSLIDSIKKNGTKVIEGDIILDTSRFQAPDYPAGVSYDDLGWYYTAPTTALMLNENTETYEVRSAEQAGLPVTITAKRPENRLKLINKIMTVAQDPKPEHCSIHLAIQAPNTLGLYGCMVVNSKPKIIQLAIPNPILMAKQIIKDTLAKNDLQLKGRILQGIMPEEATILASYHSKPLSELIKHMLLESDNLYANSLTKQLGFALNKEGSIKQGAIAIKKMLKEHTRVDLQELELTDGMGTRYNLVSPQQLVLLLRHLYQDKRVRPLIIKALPQAGVSGTLKDRMKKTLLEKHCYAKTGTMHDISSLSGYIINPKARSLVFAIIINGINQPISKAKKLEEQILLTIIPSIPDKPEYEFG